MDTKRVFIPISIIEMVHAVGKLEFSRHSHLPIQELAGSKFNRADVRSSDNANKVNRRRPDSGAVVYQFVNGADNDRANRRRFVGSLAVGGNILNFFDDLVGERGRRLRFKHSGDGKDFAIQVKRRAIDSDRRCGTAESEKVGSNIAPRDFKVIVRAVSLQKLKTGFIGVPGIYVYRNGDTNSILRRSRVGRREIKEALVSRRAKVAILKRVR